MLGCVVVTGFPFLFPSGSFGKVVFKGEIPHRLWPKEEKAKREQLLFDVVDHHSVSERVCCVSCFDVIFFHTLAQHDPFFVIVRVLFF